MVTNNKLAERLAEVNKERPTPTTPKSPPARSTPRQAEAGERWEDTHRRATFYLSNDILDQLAEFTGTNGRNKSEVVRTAVAEYLAKH